VAKQSYRDKLASAPPGTVAVLDVTKAARMKAATMYIPAPAEVAELIAAIPEGETRTLGDLRAELAALSKAQTVCPASITKYWKWLAWASDEGEGEGDGADPASAVPWWRVLKDGKPSRHLPGGVERQVMLLRAEGVEVE
jgi:alkylated DNA nucleotide flippase Atl1